MNGLLNLFTGPFRAWLAMAVVAAVMALAAAAAGVWVWGLQVGGARADARCAARQTAAVQQAQVLYGEQLRLANRHAAGALDAQRAAQATNDRLTRELAHVPRFVSVGSGVSVDGRPRAVAPPADGGPCPAPGGAGAAVEPAVAAIGDAGAAGVLTLGAVRLWNAALAGADAAAGACVADAAPGPACAAGSGITFDAAYDNALENHRRFSACLTQLNAWIDTELGRQQALATAGGESHP